MSQRQQLERIFEIDRSIRAGEFPNATRLADVLEASKRVIYNDRIFMIDRLGAPIAFNQEKGGDLIRYKFNFLTPSDFVTYFQCLREGRITDYRSELDVKLAEVE